MTKVRQHIFMPLCEPWLMKVRPTIHLLLQGVNRRIFIGIIMYIFFVKTAVFHITPEYFFYVFPGLLIRDILNELIKFISIEFIHPPFHCLRACIITCYCKNDVSVELPEPVSKKSRPQFNIYLRIE